MHDFCTYHIEVRGQVEENILNATSPLQMTVVQVNPDSTLFTIYTDQSALIGLMRHLHGHGFVIWSIYRER